MGVADQRSSDRFTVETRHWIEQDHALTTHFGEGYLGSLTQYDVIVKAPGISVTLPAYRDAIANGKQITSQTAIIFDNFPGTIVGITGTKGKSTTATLIYDMVRKSFPDTHLVGNIGSPPLDLLSRATEDTKFVYELSSHQLEGLRKSPHIAVLLNIVPEHLDYYESFNQYVDAKENITRFQNERDYLIFDSDYELPARIADRSKAQLLPCSLEASLKDGCFLDGEWVIYRSSKVEERIVPRKDVTLIGKFNLINVAAAVAAAKVAGVSTANIAEAVREFRPLEHRLEHAGEFGGVTYYNDSIATVPEATIAALDSLGDKVETVLLGGTDRGLDFSGLAKRVVGSSVKTIVLFPPSGERIWRAMREAAKADAPLPLHFFASSMDEAVALAKRNTTKNRICLLSPASPSFGMFRDYKERGEAFKRLIRDGV